MNQLEENTSQKSFISPRPRLRYTASIKLLSTPCFLISLVLCWHVCQGATTLDRLANFSAITSTAEAERKVPMGGEEKGCNGKPNSCPYTSDLNNEIEQLKVNLIKQDILKKLGLDESNLPNVKDKNVTVPDELLNSFDYADDIADDEDTDLATTQKIIAVAMLKEPGVFEFKLSVQSFARATLHFKIPYTKDQKFWVRIVAHLVDKYGFEENITSKYSPEYRDCKESMDSKKRKLCITLNIRKDLKKWLNRARRRGGSFNVSIDLMGPDGLLKESNDISEHMPYIKLEPLGLNSNRYKREAGLQCDKNSEETRCCRRPLEINFDDFGPKWDFIIAPRVYDANYCSGECSYAFLQEYTHSHIVQQTTLKGIGPCCSGRKFSSINLLHFSSDDNIVLSRLKSMIVDTCGCL